jgi:hypothetical protein
MTHVKRVEEAVKALEAFTNVDERAFDDDVAGLIEDARDGLKPLADVLGIVVEPDQEVGQATLQKRARQAALAAVDFAYSQPGLLGPAKWARVGEGVANCLMLLPARPGPGHNQDDSVEGLVHALYQALDVYYAWGSPPDQVEGIIRYRVLPYLEALHRDRASKDCTSSPARWRDRLERQGVWGPPGDPFKYGVTARDYARGLARSLVTRGADTMGEVWLAQELVPLIAGLPVAAPAS